LKEIVRKNLVIAYNMNSNKFLVYLSFVITILGCKDESKSFDNIVINYSQLDTIKYVF